MNKILILAKREFSVAVRTKSFIIGLLIAPLFMGGGLIVFALMKDNVDVDDKKIYVIDHSGLVADYLVQSAEFRNEKELFDESESKKVRPAYIIEKLQADSNDLMKQKLLLSDKIRNKEIHAFLEIGPGILYPSLDPEKAQIKYYSENSLMDDTRDWMSWQVNERIRQLKVEEFKIDSAIATGLFYYYNVEGMGLIKAGNEGGKVEEAQKSEMTEAFIIPYIMMMLMFMMVMMSAIPLLNAVMEEKTERIAEVMLGTVTPFQFMMGKILGGISVSLTGSAVYVIGGVITATQLDFADKIPYDVIPWFFAYMLLNIVMIGSIMAGLGAACNDSKDAQSLQFPAMLPVLLPLFFIMPVIKEPVSNFATWMSLIPPFTPMIMLVRQASPVEIPAWQPYAGLLGVILFTLLSVYVGSRIFRTFILMSGQKPTLGNLIKFAFRK